MNLRKGFCGQHQEKAREAKRELMSVRPKKICSLLVWEQCGGLRVICPSRHSAPLCVGFKIHTQRREPEGCKGAFSPQQSCLYPRGPWRPLPSPL